MLFDQQGDVLLFQTLDDGEINVENGLFQMTGGFETMIYLCLFGGNIDDDGSDAANAQQYWGNLIEPDSDNHCRSETQSLLESTVPSISNLLSIEDAAERDLAIFKSAGIADTVQAVASLPAINTLQLSVVISANGQQQQFNFTENWKAV